MPKTILLADDSVTIQKVVELTFMDGDYHVVAVSNGDEAIARLDAERPDFVIADVHMPGADGYAVCEHSKERYPGVPTLLLVGTFEPFDEQRAEGCGAGGHLKKPFDSQELLRRVEEMSRPGAQPEAAGGAAPAAAVAEPHEVEEPGVEASAEDRKPAVASVTPITPAAGGVPDEELAQEEDTAVGWSGVAGDAEEAPDFTLEEGDEVPATLVSPPEEPEERGEEETSEATQEAEPVPASGAGSVATAAAQTGEGGAASPLSEEDLDRLAQRVVQQLSDKIVREVAWEVLPDLAEVVIKERIRQLEAEVE